MEQAIHIVENDPATTVEIVVHITETLGDERRKDLVAALESEKSIISAEF